MVVYCCCGVQGGQRWRHVSPLSFPTDLSSDPSLQTFDLGGNVDAAVVCVIANVRNSRLQLRNGLFELKKRGHWRLALLAVGLAVNEWMLRSDEFEQRIRLQMGVDFGRRDVGMAQHRLHRAQEIGRAHG